MSASDLTIINFATDMANSTFVYPDKFEEKIGFDRIRDLACSYSIGPIGEKKIRDISFSADSLWIGAEHNKVAEFQHILREEDAFPDTIYFDLGDCLTRLRIEGTFPEIQEMFELKRSIETGKAITLFFKRSKEDLYPALKSLSGGVILYPMISDKIDQIIDKTGTIRDSASKELSSIRSSISSRKSQVSKKLSSILRQAQSDGIVETGAVVSLRNGRAVIPVNAGDKRRIRGMVHDQSATGKTVFIEPEDIVELNNEIAGLEYEERREIVRILTTFADFLRPYIPDILPLFDFLGELDSVRARALLGNELKCDKPEIRDRTVIAWRKARHPILEITFRRSGRKVVPLDIELDERERILVISGPNAGGKSVCLKTVGLLQYMMQCGFPVPVGPGSTFGVFEKILLDIGDEQSIENDLSTYSSHLINMKHFLKASNNRSLVLIDEFGAGTEPMIGGAIAEAVLQFLNDQKVFGVFTTHYTNLKHFAANTEGVVNGAMSYDNNLMQPLFEMVKGKPGSSFAFEIARKIGLPEQVLGIASEKVGKDNINFDKHLREIARDRKYWERKRQDIRRSEKRIEELLEKYESEIGELKQKKKEILLKARTEAEQLMQESNRQIENTIRSIKEAHAEKEKTREARKKLEGFKEQIEALKDEEEKLPGISKIAGVNREIERRDNQKVSGKKKTTGDQLKKGDFIRVTDTDSYGQIESIKGQIATIITGNVSMQINSSKLERVSQKEVRSNERKGTSVLNWEITATRNNFKPEIDIRGERTDEALEKVRDLVDTAFMVGYRTIRILHGKGTGILRENVRQYLATHPAVASFRDEHVDFGGAGITVAELEV